MNDEKSNFQVSGEMHAKRLREQATIFREEDPLARGAANLEWAARWIEAISSKGCPTDKEIEDLCEKHGLGPSVGKLVVRDALKRWGAYPQPDTTTEATQQIPVQTPGEPFDMNTMPRTSIEALRAHAAQFKEYDRKVEEGCWAMFRQFGYQEQYRPIWRDAWLSGRSFEVEDNMPCPICQGIEGCDHTVLERQHPDINEIFERQQAGFDRCYEALGIKEEDRVRSWSALVLNINDVVRQRDNLTAPTRDYAYLDDPNGWALVPKYPTTEQQDAICQAGDSVTRMYKSAIAAAPKPKFDVAPLPVYWQFRDRRDGDDTWSKWMICPESFCIRNKEKENIEYQFRSLGVIVPKQATEQVLTEEHQKIIRDAARALQNGEYWHTAGKLLALLKDKD